MISLKSYYRSSAKALMLNNNTLQHTGYIKKLISQQKINRETSNCCEIAARRGELML